jgi:hypothetical protein
MAPGPELHIQHSYIQTDIPFGMLACESPPASQPLNNVFDPRFIPSFQKISVWLNDDYLE